MESLNFLDPEEFLEGVDPRDLHGVCGPRCGEWELRELPSESWMEDAPPLVYEEMRWDTPPEVYHHMEKEGFAHPDTIKWVWKWHIVKAARRQHGVVASLREVRFPAGACPMWSCYVVVVASRSVRCRLPLVGRGWKPSSMLGHGLPFLCRITRCLLVGSVLVVTD